MRHKIVAMALILLSSVPAAARTVGSAPLPLGSKNQAATLLLLQLLEQELRAREPGIQILRVPGQELSPCLALVAPETGHPGGPAEEQLPAGTADPGDEARTLPGCWDRLLRSWNTDELVAGAVTGQDLQHELQLLRHGSGRLTRSSVKLNASPDNLALALRFLVERFLNTGTLVEAGRGDLLVRPSPPQAEVLVQSRPLGQGPLFVSGVSAGPVEVAARAEQHRDGRLGLEVAEGELNQAQLRLEPGLEGWPAPRQRTWIGLGSTLGLALAGAVLGLVQRSTQQQFDELQVREDTMPELVDLRERGESYARGANTAFALAGAALLASGVSWFFEYRQARQEAESLSTRPFSTDPGEANP